MKKIAVGVIITLCVVLTTFTIVRDAQAQTDWENNREIITVMVHQGDTIDGYWVEYAPSWMSREQYRYEIQTLNDMESCMLYIGDTIKLYVQGGN